MQSTTYCHMRTVATIRPRYRSSPAMQLEDEAAEETAIRDLETQIREARGNDELLESLKRQRRQIYDSWIERLNRDIGKADRKGDHKTKDSLIRQRERATRDYSDYS